MPCPLCTNPTAAISVSADGQEVNCGNCGRSVIDVASIEILTRNPELAFQVGCWVNSRKKIESPAFITKRILDGIWQGQCPSVEKRAEAYLGAVISRHTGRLTGRFCTTDLDLRTAGWCYHAADAIALAQYLTNEGAFYHHDGDPGNYRILTPRGLQIFEKMANQRASSSQAFVAMWFNESMNAAYNEGIAVAIDGAGYEPLRIDGKEHTNKIDDEIIAEIRRSAFIVADFTGQRGGVYYEAGFAHGLQKPVIFTCRSDAVSELHFDVRQYNAILWNQPTNIIKPLQNRILALFGAGPKNPSSAPI